MANPNTASPVRSQEVEAAIEFFFSQLTNIHNEGTKHRYGHGKTLLAYIAQLEASQPAVTSGAVESEAWPIMYQAAEDADATSGYGFPCWDDKIVAAGSDKVWAVAYAAGVASTQLPAAEGKLREALANIQAELLSDNKDFLRISRCQVFCREALAQPASGGGE